MSDEMTTEKLLENLEATRQHGPHDLHELVYQLAKKTLNRGVGGGGGSVAILGGGFHALRNEVYESKLLEAKQLVVMVNRDLEKARSEVQALQEQRERTRQRLVIAIGIDGKSRDAGLSLDHLVDKVVDAREQPFPAIDGLLVERLTKEVAKLKHDLDMARADREQAEQDADSSSTIMTRLTAQRDEAKARVEELEGLLSTQVHRSKLCVALGIPADSPHGADWDQLIAHVDRLHRAADELQVQLGESWSTIGNLRADLAKEISAHLETKHDFAKVAEVHVESLAAAQRWFAELSRAVGLDPDSEHGKAAGWEDLIAAAASDHRNVEENIRTLELPDYHERVVVELSKARSELDSIKARPFEFLRGLGYTLGSSSVRVTMPSYPPSVPIRLTTETEAGRPTYSVVPEVEPTTQVGQGAKGRTDAIAALSDIATSLGLASRMSGNGPWIEDTRTLVLDSIRRLHLELKRDRAVLSDTHANLSLANDENGALLVKIANAAAALR